MNSESEKKEEGKDRGLIQVLYQHCAGPSGRAVLGAGLRPLASWNCGCASHRGRGCLSAVSVVYLLTSEMRKQSACM